MCLHILGSSVGFVLSVSWDGKSSQSTVEVINIMRKLIVMGPDSNLMRGVIDTTGGASLIDSSSARSWKRFSHIKYTSSHDGAQNRNWERDFGLVWSGRALRLSI